MRKRWVRFRLAAAATVAIMAVSAALFWWFSWTSPSPYMDYAPMTLPVPIMTDNDYRKVHATHPQPFILRLQSARGALLVYGAEHTRDPKNRQISDIREQWAAFQPTVALVEGRLGFLPAIGVDPVRAFGESGEVVRLARAAGIPVYIWELPIEQEVANGLQTHSPERVALFYVLRPYFGQFRHGRPADPDAFAESYRRKRTKWPGLENTLPSVAAIDVIWKRDFPDRPDWRDTSDQYRLPGYLGEIYSATNARRDEHFAQLLIHLVGQGHRVFAVAGSSHPVKLEPALRSVFQDGK